MVAAALTVMPRVARARAPAGARSATGALSMAAIVCVWGGCTWVYVCRYAARPGRPAGEYPSGAWFASGRSARFYWLVGNAEGFGARLTVRFLT